MKTETQMNTEESKEKFKILYMAQILYDWDKIRIAENIPINPQKEMGKYFFPVFDSREECEKVYPEVAITVLKIRKSLLK